MAKFEAASFRRNEDQASGCGCASFSHRWWLHRRRLRGNVLVEGRHVWGYLYSEISGVYLPEYSNDNDSLYLQGPKRCEIIFRLP